MTAFNWISHGTQHVDPTFRTEGVGIAPCAATLIAILDNVDAMVGGALFGTLSQGTWVWSRRT